MTLYVCVSAVYIVLHTVQYSTVQYTADDDDDDECVQLAVTRGANRDMLNASLSVSLSLCPCMCMCEQCNCITSGRIGLNLNVVG